jgi:hypothetical protein
LPISSDPIAGPTKKVVVPVINFEGGKIIAIEPFNSILFWRKSVALEFKQNGET